MSDGWKESTKRETAEPACTQQIPRCEQRPSFPHHPAARSSRDVKEPPVTETFAAGQNTKQGASMRT